MKVYISASFIKQHELRAVRDAIWRLGHEVVSSWLDEVAQPANMPRDTWYEHLAVKDQAEVKAADVLILDLEHESTTGGRYVEWGMALEQAGKLKVIVGEPRGVFEARADEVFATWKECLAWLKSVAPSKS